MKQRQCSTTFSLIGMKNPLRIVGILLVGVLSTVVRVVVAQPAQEPFTIVNDGSDLCLEPNGSGLGEPILQQPCDSTKLTQRWRDMSVTTTDYVIRNEGNPSMCLDVRNGVNANRTVVQQWDCRNVPSMRWQYSNIFRDSYKVVSNIGSRCLDVAAGSLERGARIQIYSCTPGSTNTAQIWTIR
jgi:hypothetical protein